MEFQEFREELLKRVNTILPNGISAMYQEVQKNNGVIYTGMMLDMSSESGISAVLYAEQLFECFLHGEPIGEIAEKVKDTFLRQEVPWQLSDVYSYDKVRDRIVCRLFGASQNRDRIDHEPHRRILDMMLSYAVMFDNGGGTQGMMTITKDLMQEWGVNETMLYTRAMENTARMMGERMVRLSEYCGERDTERTKPLRVLTNRQQFYGATAILYSRKMRAYAEQTESNLYIVPLSVHEVIVMPRMPGEYDGIRGILSLLHADAVKEEDILTDSIYVYDLAKDLLRVEKVNGAARA